MILHVRVIPRARSAALAGRRGDALLIRLSAPPVDGAANDALVQFLADTFRCRRQQVSILSGHTARDKRVRIEGITEAELSSRLAAILDAPA